VQSIAARIIAAEQQGVHAPAPALVGGTRHRPVSRSETPDRPSA
jgi:hypothetical protein